jgi:hypothetical protein
LVPPGNRGWFWTRYPGLEHPIRNSDHGGQSFNHINEGIPAGEIETIFEIVKAHICCVPGAKGAAHQAAEFGLVADIENVALAHDLCHYSKHLSLSADPYLTEYPEGAEIRTGHPFLQLHCRHKILILTVPCHNVFLLINY